jgi:hypothetical protein
MSWTAVVTVYMINITHISCSSERPIKLWSPSESLLCSWLTYFILSFWRQNCCSFKHFSIFYCWLENIIVAIWEFNRIFNYTFYIDYKIILTFLNEFYESCLVHNLCWRLNKLRSYVYIKIIFEDSYLLSHSYVINFFREFHWLTSFTEFMD